MSAPLTCVACGPGGVLDEASVCRRCERRFFEAGEIAAEAGIEERVLKDIAFAGRPGEYVCTGCQIPMRRVRVRGASIDVCRGCGGAVTEAEELDVLRGGPRSPVARRPSRPRTGSREPSSWDRVRLSLIPVVSLAGPALFFAAASQLTLSSTLVGAAGAIAVPAPTAVLVRFLVPSRKALAASVAAHFAAFLIAFVSVVAGASLPPIATAAISGAAFAVAVSASHRAAKRIAIVGVVGAVMTVGVFKAQAALDARAREGCPDGARWTSVDGRHCERADGKRHGPGIRAIGDRVLERGRWEEGQRQGSFVTFDLEGNKAGEGLFYHDQEVGPWLIYSGGRLSESGEFRHGKRHGSWIQYADDGRPELVREYSNGVEE